jgi:hypothetical protein
MVSFDRRQAPVGERSASADVALYVPQTVGERHPHEFGLAAVVATAGMGVPVDSAYGCGVGIDVVSALRRRRKS